MINTHLLPELMPCLFTVRKTKKRACWICLSFCERCKTVSLQKNVWNEIFQKQFETVNGKAYTVQSSGMLYLLACIISYHCQDLAMCDSRSRPIMNNSFWSILHWIKSFRPGVFGLAVLSLWIRAINNGMTFRYPFFLFI